MSFTLGRTPTETSAEAAACVASPANSTRYVVDAGGVTVQLALPAASVTPEPIVVNPVAPARCRVTVSVAPDTPGSDAASVTGSPATTVAGSAVSASVGCAAARATAGRQAASAETSRSRTTAASL